MIHIDDLVRQRLGGGEESERPGGWLAMRALLDKEMPAAVASGTNWRRVIGYFTGLLLLTTASVGGYKMYNRNGVDTRIAAESSGAGKPAARNIAAASSSARPVKYSIGDEQTVRSSTTPLQKTNIPAAATHSSAASTARHINSTAAHIAETASSVHHSNGLQTTAPDINTSVARNNAARPNVKHTHLPSVKPGNETPADAAVNSTHAIASNINRDYTDPAASGAVSTSSKAEPSGAPASGRTFASSANAVIHGRRKSADATRVQGADTRILPASSIASLATKPMTAPALVKHVYDTIQRIELVTRRIYDANTQKAVFRIDTFPSGKVVVDRIVPQPQDMTALDAPAKTQRNRSTLRRNGAAGDQPVASVASAKNLTSASGNRKTDLTNQILPASKPVADAQADPSATDNANLVSLSKFKVSSKHFRLWDAEKFDAAVNKFKFNLARIQMYPGVMGGINASIFTPNALGGFQVGLTSLFVLNDWWSLMTELKYLHRFNTGSTVRDDYMNVIPGSGSVTFTGPQPNGLSYKAYEWKDEHVDHYFNYEVVQTLELPLALRYSWGRFYSQGGLNFVYSMKINAAEVTRARGDVTSHRELRQAAHDDEPFINNDAPLVLISDFGARFGTGYVLGGGFMFTPAVYIDFRIAQTFWDNANTGGAKHISKDLLRTPSVQVSVGYRFSQQKH